MSDFSSRNHLDLIRPGQTSGEEPVGLNAPQSATGPFSIVIVGAGGFAREVMDVIEAIQQTQPTQTLRVIGATAVQMNQRQMGRLVQRGIHYLGADAEFLEGAPKGALYVVAVGHPPTRAALARTYRSSGLRPVTLIHPDATIGSRTRLGSGVVICAGARISTNVTLGDHAHVNPGALIGHDAALGDCTSINPGAIISGEATVGARTLVGAGAVVLEQRTVGSDCVIGAAACVTHDVSDGTTVAGVPARPLGPSASQTAHPR